MEPRSFSRKILILAFAALACSGVAQAQDANLKARIEQLEAQQSKNAQELARAISLLTKIQQDFQAAQGQLEASKYLEKESDRVYQDLDVRVSSVEDRIDQVQNLVKTVSQASVGVPPPAGKSPGAKPVNNAAENEEFEKLIQVFNAKDYTAAASGWMGFLKKYPASAQAGSAQYWLAESYYALGDYAKSIQEFQVVIEKYPQHRFLKEAYYKQGQGFSNLKKYPEAKLFFQKLISNYPQTAEAAKAQTRLHRIQALEKNSPTAATTAEASKPDAGTSPVYQPIMKPVPAIPNPITAPNPTPPPPPPPPASTPNPNSGAPLF